MLQCAKKLLIAADSLVGSEKNTEASWIYNDAEGEPLDHVKVSPFSPIFFMWQAWRQFGTLPVKGGYFDQPLQLMAQIEAIEMVVGANQIINSPDSDWSQLTADQTEMIGWLKKVKNG